MVKREAESPEIIKRRWDFKKEQIEILANNIQKLRYNVTLGLKDSDNEKVFLTALVVAIILETSERVGNEASASNGHVGVCGLKKKQISIDGNKITLEYTGKSGVEHIKSFSDEKIAKALKLAIKRSKTDDVFCTSDGFKIKADRINRYLSDFQIRSKDIRGHSANKWMLEKLKNGEIEDNENKRKKFFMQSLRKTAIKVGHGASTLRKHYLIPELETNYIKNGTIINLNERESYEEGGEIKIELLAPNGKKSNLTPEQYKLVRTPEFKKWFGDWENDPENSSKVVDDNGEPLVVYHGTNESFNEFSNKFNKRMSGFYFSNNIENAKTYGNKILSVFINVKNPLIIDSKGKNFTEDLTVKVLAKYPQEQPYETELEIDLDEVVYMTKIGKRENSFIEIKNNENYDGNIFKNLIDPSLSSLYSDENKNQDTIVAFEPAQIKLADGTNVAFDSENQDIRFEKGGEIKETFNDGANLSKTPAPKKDKIYGSKINKPESAESKYNASSIILSPNVIKSIVNIIHKHNEEYPEKKINISTAKAVVRRGMGAYSSTHRPTISEGKPNSRVAWGLARLNAFVYKIQNGKSKSGKYNQDDDLIDELGYKVKSYSKGGSVRDEFKCNYEKYFEYVPLSEIEKYIEFDREVEHKISKEYLDELTEEIKVNGITYPITLEIYGGKGLIVEGNHRIAVAKRLGIKYIPVRVIERYRPFTGTIYENKVKELPSSSNVTYAKAMYGVQPLDWDNSAAVHGFTKVEPKFENGGKIEFEEKSILDKFNEIESLIEVSSTPMQIKYLFKKLTEQSVKIRKIKDSDARLILLDKRNKIKSKLESLEELSNKGLSGNLNEKYAYHFIAVGGLTEILESGSSLKKMSITTNPIFGEEEVSTPRQNYEGYYGAESTVEYFSDLPIKIVFDLQKLIKSGVKIIKGSAKNGTYFGEYELIVNNEKGKLKIFDYILWIEIDSKYKNKILDSEIDIYDGKEFRESTIRDILSKNNVQIRDKQNIDVKKYLFEGKTPMYENGGELIEDKITFDNFYKGTKADFKEIMKVGIPKRKPDFVSDSGSKYWFTSNSVIRQSDHWGQLDACEWTLDGRSGHKITQGICPINNFSK